MLVRLTTLVDRVEGLRLRVMAAAMDVADVEGAPTVAAWLAPRTRATTRSLHGREQLARGMDRRWQVVGAGVAAGTVSAGAGGGDRPGPGSPRRPGGR